jgi:hypothetical protein
MRTVSFSSPAVRNSMRDFVCHHTSTEGDPTAGQSIRHRPDEPAGTCIRGNGPQNVQTLFLTPRGEIFHVVSGFVPADELVQEMEYARQLFHELSGNGSDASRQVVANSHRNRLVELGLSDGQISARGIEGTLAGMLGNRGGMNLEGFDPLTGNVRAAMSGMPNAMTAGFEPLIRGQVLTDHRFMIERPLESAADFERDPTPLVGNGQSFFSSQSGGG